MKKTLITLAVLFAVHAQADHHKKHAKMSPGMCKESITQFCADVKDDATHVKGDGKMMACLKMHEAEITEASCKEHMASMKEMREERKEFFMACKSDLKTHCKDVKKGKGNKMQCLKDKAATGATISDTCKAELDMGMGKNPS